MLFHLQLQYVIITTNVKMTGRKEILLSIDS